MRVYLLEQKQKSEEEKKLFETRKCIKNCPSMRYFEESSEYGSRGKYGIDVQKARRKAKHFYVH